LNRTALLFLVYLIVFTSVASQSITVADSVTKKGLSFVAVKFQDSGLYTNERGLFNWPNDRAVENVELIYLGYKNLQISYGSVKDTIYMSPISTALDEVIVSNVKKHKRQHVKPGKKTRFFGDFPLSSKIELLTVLYPNGKYLDAYIEKVYFPIAKKFAFEVDSKTAEAVVRVNIYRVVDSLPAEQLFQSKPIKISGYSRDEIVVDISDEIITMTTDGLCFGVEMIGFYDNNQEVTLQKSFVRQQLTAESGKVFSAKSYYRYLLSENTELKSIKSFIKKSMDAFNMNRDYNYNLSIGFDLSLH